MRNLSIILSALVFCSFSLAEPPTPAFKKLVLTDKFYSEGASFADFNKDGRLDVVSGPFWYEGPDFQKKHEIYTPKAYDPLNYADIFLTFAYDFNNDSFPDVLHVGFPGKETYWYENPGQAPGPWKRHVAFDVTDNESPMFGDINGDGKPELIFNTGGRLGYASPDWSNPDKPWTFHPISPNAGYHKYTHGIGLGDVNGDGRTDFLEAKAWWEQPANPQPDQPWIKHQANFADEAVQMYAYDVDGDGLNDIVTVVHCHRYGLAWHKQLRSPTGQITFEKRLIMGSKPEENPQGFKVSQLHSLALADLNGDGLRDLVSGKRFWAHGPKGDVEPDAPAMLLWFELRRDKDKGPYFIAHQIDDDSGAGMHIETADLNADGIPDIITANKKGAFVHLSQRPQRP